MKFRTAVSIEPVSEDLKIDYNNSIVFMGSCFTENIGIKMQESKFRTTINPFGVLYNPVSIANGIKMLIHNAPFKRTELRFKNGLWFSFYHHSKFSHPDAEQCLKQINEEQHKASEILKNAKYLFLTFGTGRVYTHTETQEIVSNCHKIPAKEFTQHLLTVDEIVEIYERLIPALRNFNSNIQIIFTVSPVRHWKDGAFGNQLNKAVLFLAIDKLMQKHEYIQYFPAYECVIDDLRDYRFYKEDMLHINETAIQYIWELFRQTYFSKETEQQYIEIEKLVKSGQHRPMNIGSKEHVLFLKTQMKKIELVLQKNPKLDFSTEYSNYHKELTKISTGK